MKLPFTLRFEQRTDDIPKWLPAVTSLGSVLVAFLISGIVLALIGGEPLRVLKFFFTATFGSWPVCSWGWEMLMPEPLFTGPRYSGLYGARCIRCRRSLSVGCWVV